MALENIDKKIEELFTVVQMQKQEVEKAEKETKRGWNTNCSFKLYSSTPVNLMTANEDSIIKACAELLTWKDSMTKALDILGLKKSFSHDGYTVEQWLEDFQKRVATIHLKEKKDKLKKLEERLTSIVSPEQKRQMELQSIMKDLGE